MPLYDYSKFPQGLNHRRDFVLSLLGQSELRESDFIEVKSEFDLMNRQHQIKVAKFILGAANRTPDSASRHLGGYAVLVAGLGRDRIIGIQGEELIDLSKEVQKLIGAPGDGPDWFTERVDFEDGKTVLMVFVSPPTGSIYPCLATTGKELVSGTVYIRNPGQTKAITGPQLRAKVRKLEAGSNPNLQLSVNHLGSIVELKPRFGSARELVMNQAKRLREDAPAVVEKSDEPNDIASMLNIQITGRLKNSKDFYGRTPEEFHADLDMAGSITEHELSGLALALLCP
ncbi:hypothetical protein [Corynebacterium sp. LaCa116]|uniref:hypothetical protein n=1 Tax=Corynebacterium sp. LaCa116 TaxID=3391423 RepID=UPI003989C183